MKKVVLFLTVLGCFISGNANAGRISGYGISYKSIDVFLELRGAGNTEGDRIEVDIVLTEVEYVCQNPGVNQYVVNGAPGNFSLGTEVPIDTVTSVTKNGRTTVNVSFDLEDPSLGVYDSVQCVNLNWSVVLGSLAPSALEATAIWYDDDNTETDRVEAVCTLDPILRYPEGTTIGGEDVSYQVVKGQIFDCVDITDL